MRSDLNLTLLGLSNLLVILVYIASFLIPQNPVSCSVKTIKPPYHESTWYLLHGLFLGTKERNITLMEQRKNHEERQRLQTHLQLTAKVSSFLRGGVVLLFNSFPSPFNPLSMVHIRSVRVDRKKDAAGNVKLSDRCF